MGITHLTLGIDLAGVSTRPTGICILKGTQSQTSLVYTDDEILNIANIHHPAVIAIDAPLSLPLDRKTIEDRSGKHLRFCDRVLLRRKIKFFPVTIGPMRSLTRRGMALKTRLESQEYRVIEVYPGGAQDLLSIPRKQKGIDKLKVGLEELGITGLRNDLSDHELDAVTAAYVGKLHLEGKAEVYGNFEEGAIVMPHDGRRHQKNDSLSNN
jgi:predicted nuclease with RNAse H fold